MKLTEKRCSCGKQKPNDGIVHCCDRPCYVAKVEENPEKAMAVELVSELDSMTKGMFPSMVLEMIEGRILRICNRAISRYCQDLFKEWKEERTNEELLPPEAVEWMEIRLTEPRI